MKKFVLLFFLVGLLFYGCSSDFMAHDTTYKNWDHMRFSWWGYRQPTQEDVQNSTEQGWWGQEIPYIPAE
ncbi:MAG: hypothetical protein JSW39_16745 [Desulfobacterales bacterium]|nr:MAG: hypothetical protein JSW39_16745 [Desulfobacterales bacterium]